MKYDQMYRKPLYLVVKNHSFMWIRWKVWSKFNGGYFLRYFSKSPCKTDDFSKFSDWAMNGIWISSQRIDPAKLASMGLKMLEQNPSNKLATGEIYYPLVI